jgi:A/G-specific adenine glycosylase
LPPILSPEEILSFRKEIYRYYKKNRRSFPWRDTYNPYYILVSEVMLQQTQVERVNGKYQEFLAAFPDFSALARAELNAVLRAWSGLGYNRRAISLIKLAKTVVADYDGNLPQDIEVLASLPGIGKATAGSLAAFAFNQPSVFAETNIRRVFIHFFFRDSENVHDREVLRLVETTLDRTSPREWYYALMDYGAMLKKAVLNPNRRSAHYKRQPPFESSDRKIRGAVIRALLEGQPLQSREIAGAIEADPDRVDRLLVRMRDEGLVREDHGGYYIP